MQVVEIGKTEEGRPHLAAIVTAPENFAKLDRYKQISQQLHRRARHHRSAGARAREGRQGGRLDRRRPARDRSGRRAPADGDRLSACQPHRRGDHAHPARRDRRRRARQSRRHADGVEVLHADRGADAAPHLQPAALREVRRARQQPRLLHVEHEGIPEHEQAHVLGVAAADHVQPSPVRPGRHGDLLAAVPRSVQLQLRSDDRHRPRHGRRGDAPPLPAGREARLHDALRRDLFDVVERRPAHDGLLPEHHRPADRDHRQPDAVADSGDAEHRSCRAAICRRRSRRSSGISASRSTTRSPRTTRCSTSRRATRISSSTTSTRWASNQIERGSRDHWTISNEDMVRLQAAIAPPAPAGGSGGRRRRTRRRARRCPGRSAGGCQTAGGDARRRRRRPRRAGIAWRRTTRC